MSLTDDQIVAKNFQKFYNGILPYLNGSAHSGFTPIGTVISVMGTTAPLNYLACDGTVYNIADYTELAAYFNQQFGSSNFFGGNGTTTFAVPDLRGEFLRGTGTNSHANQGSGANVGVHQDGTLQQNVYCTTDNNQIQIPVKSFGSVTNTDKTVSTGDYIVYSQGTRYSYTGVTSTFTSRPTNTSVLYCIASKNIFMDAGMNYSTEEQVVGTWIDGSYIWQKTVDCGALPNNSSKLVNHGISNFDRAIKIDGIAYNSSNNANTQLDRTDDSIAGMIVLSVNRTSIYIATGNDKSGYVWHVTLLYTKTTD